MKYMLKSCIQWGSCLLSALVLNGTSAQTVHIAHCLAGCPTGAPAANEIVVRHLFAASINYQSGLADWIAYRVLPGTVGVASLLPRVWQPDELLAQSTLEEIDSAPGFLQPDLSDQQDSAYRVNEIIINPEDRGRLVPMSSFAGTPYWEDLNFLSNMAPIPGDLRIGPWSRLDQAINELAAREGDVFIVSGPLYGDAIADNGDSKNGNGPTAFFKFIATATSHTAFVFPYGVAQHGSYCDQLTGAVALEERSGLRFLPERSELGAPDLHRLLGCSNI